MTQSYAKQKASSLQPRWQLEALFWKLLYGRFVTVSRGIVVAPVVVPVVVPIVGVYGGGGVAMAPAVAPAAVSYAALSSRPHAPMAINAATDATVASLRVI
jgi:hypothetical protein